MGPSDVLDPDRSISLGELDSPPTTKKRKLGATESTKSHVGVSVPLPFPCSFSVEPIAGPKLQDAPAERDDQSTVISPPLARSSDYEYHAPDSDVIVASSRTQHLHLAFTPESPRVEPIDPARSPSPVFKLDSRMSGWPRTSSNPSVSHIPTNQVNVPGPAIPKKRARTFVEYPEDVSQTQRLLDAPVTIMPSFEEVMANVPVPNRPRSFNMPSELSLRDRLTETGTFTPCFASPRQAPRKHGPRLFEQVPLSLASRNPGDLSLPLVPFNRALPRAPTTLLYTRHNPTSLPVPNQRLWDTPRSIRCWPP